MPNYTTNYNLKKPLQTENYNVDDFNGNADITDTQLKALADAKVDKVAGKVLSDENYTAAEKAKIANVPENTNAQLADKVQNFKIKNEIVNGNFTNNFTNWENVGAPIKSINEGFAEITPNIDGAGIAQPYNFVNGRKYFFSVIYKGLAFNLRLRTGLGGTTDFSTGILADEINDKRLSFVHTPTLSPLYLHLVGNNAPGAYYVKEVLVIDLTSIFSTDNEPTKLEMDELMKIIPNGWWDGELSLTQKQYITWQLNLIRKNTNAIIALGGTIV